MGNSSIRCVSGIILEKKRRGRGRLLLGPLSQMTIGGRIQGCFSDSVNKVLEVGGANREGWGIIERA